MKKRLNLKQKFLSENLSRAKKRKDGKDFNVDVAYLYQLGLKQNWRCAISGVALEFTRGGTMWGGKWCNPLSCSIDRINNSFGYVKGNLQLVTWAQNASRGITPLKEYKKIMGYK